MIKIEKLIYTNEQISTILKIIDGLKIEGINNLKSISTILMIIESPVETELEEEKIIEKEME